MTIEELRRDVADGFGNIDRRLDAVEQRFVVVDERFARIDERFDRIPWRNDSIDVSARSTRRCAATSM